MARYNSVEIFGILLEPPKIIKKNGEIKHAKMLIQTARRSYMNENLHLAGDVRMDVQVIRTQNVYHIETWISRLKQGDLVLIDGTISTKDIPSQKARCPQCGEVGDQGMGVEVYVDPSDILKFPGEYTQEEAVKLIIEHADRSNRVRFFSTILEEPRYAPDEGATKRQLDCHVALNRRRFIPEDGPDKKADYPWIRVYGRMAEEGSKVLHAKSEIFVDGAIQVREIENAKACPYCGVEFYVDHPVVELIPYSIEYTENCDVEALAELKETGKLLTNNVEQEIELEERMMNRDWSGEPESVIPVFDEKPKAPEKPKKKRGRPRKNPEPVNMNEYASLYDTPYFALPGTNPDQESSDPNDNFWTSTDPEIVKEREEILNDIREYEDEMEGPDE